MENSQSQDRLIKALKQPVKNTQSNVIILDDKPIIPDEQLLLGLAAQILTQNTSLFIHAIILAKQKCQPKQASLVNRGKWFSVIHLSWIYTPLMVVRTFGGIVGQQLQTIVDPWLRAGKHSVQCTGGWGVYTKTTLKPSCKQSNHIP